MKKKSNQWISLFVSALVILFVIIGLIANWSGNPHVRQYWIDAMLGVIFVVIFLRALIFFFYRMQNRRK